MFGDTELRTAGKMVQNSVEVAVHIVGPEAAVVLEPVLQSWRVVRSIALGGAVDRVLDDTGRRGVDDLERAYDRNAVVAVVHAAEVHVPAGGIMSVESSNQH